MGLKNLPPAVLAALTAGGTGVGVNAEALGADIPEAEFQAAVIAHATANGWQAFSIPDSRRATCGGFQDTTFARDPELNPWPWVVVAELKRVGQEPRRDQWLWLRAWEAMGVPAFVWRPTATDWAEIRRVLS
jgi:hypothetical protein